MRALRTGDVLVVWKLDRLGRNLAHLVNTVQNLSTRGAIDRYTIWTTRRLISPEAGGLMVPARLNVPGSCRPDAHDAGVDEDQGAHRYRVRLWTRPDGGGSRGGLGVVCYYPGCLVTHPYTVRRV